MGDGVDEIAVGVLGEALEGHHAAGGMPDQTLQLIAPVHGNLGVGVQGKAPHAGTAGTGQRWRLAFNAKPRANAPDFLASLLPEGAMLLHRGGHGTGQLGHVVTQRIMPRRYHIIRANVQIPQLPQRADDASADRLDHSGDVGIAGRLAFDIPGLEALDGELEIDAYGEDHMISHRSQSELGSLEASYSRRRALVEGAGHVRKRPGVQCRTMAVAPGCHK